MGIPQTADARKVRIRGLAIDLLQNRYQGLRVREAPLPTSIGDTAGITSNTFC